MSYLESAAVSVQARARIRLQIYETPLLTSRSKANLFFKAESFQLTGLFKLRGAMSMISASTTSSRFIIASSGNHSIGAARATSKLERDLIIVLPETVVPAKLAKIRQYGVNAILHGAETGLAEHHAQKLSREESYTYVSPYNDPDIIAGQGTIGLRILEQCLNFDNVFISMGGGGLISGIGSVFKAFAPKAKVYGASANASRALTASMQIGKVVETEHLPTLAEAVAGGIDDDIVTLSLDMQVVNEIVDCDEDDVRRSLKVLVLEENMLMEGRSALALAAYRKMEEKVQGQVNIVVLCGANFDQDTVMQEVFGQ
jgi:threonine dehydratase